MKPFPLRLSRAGAARSQRGRADGKALNVALVFATVSAGAAAWVLGNVLYGQALGTLPRPLLIGVLFGLLAGLTMATIVAVGKAKGTFEANLITRRGGPGSVMGVLVAGCVALALLAMLFEWLYELEAASETHEPTSYVFVVDDSGSMGSNDPDQSRFAAITTVLEGVSEEFPFMVYRFSNDVEVLRGMEPASVGTPQLEGAQEGGTSLKAALNQVLDDHVAGAWDGGEYPKVILLTDGLPTDTAFFDTLSAEMKRFTNARISVSTVGLGDADDALMQRIARATGGVYVRSPDAAGLAQAMSSAAVMSADRDLLSARCNAQPDLLYAVLRVLFLFLLGCMLGPLAALAYGSFGSAPLIVVTAIVESLTGALAMELGVGVFGLPAELMWLALWVLLALTVALIPVVGGRLQPMREHRSPLLRDAAILSVRR